MTAPFILDAFVILSGSESVFPASPLRLLYAIQVSLFLQDCLRRGQNGTVCSVTRVQWWYARYTDILLPADACLEVRERR